MEHTYPFWTAVSVVVAIATTTTWWIVRQQRIRAHRHGADLRSIEQWMQARDAIRRRQLVDQYGPVVDLRDVKPPKGYRAEMPSGFADPRDAGSTTVGHALGVVLVLAGLLLLLAVCGAVETAGL